MPRKAIPRDKLVHLDAPNPDAPGTTYGEQLRDARSVEDDVTTKVWYDQFYSNLRGLHRKVFDLRLQGLKQREIADMVGITQTQVARILRKIKSTLEEGR